MSDMEYQYPAGMSIEEVEKNKRFVEAVKRNIPKKGWWYEIVDYSEEDYRANYGFMIFHNGELVAQSFGSFSSFKQAGNEAYRMKQRLKARKRE